MGLIRRRLRSETMAIRIFVEGQMDLVMSHQAGIKNTVAVSGTALADTTVTKDAVVNNLGMVRRLSTNVIFAFDSDAAGRKAAMRSAQIALSLEMGREDRNDVARQRSRGHDPRRSTIMERCASSCEAPSSNSSSTASWMKKTKKKLDDRKLPAMLIERVYPFVAALSSQSTQAIFVKMVRDRIFGNSVTDGFIWDDIRDVRKKMQAEAAKSQANNPPFNNTGQQQGQNGIVSRTATGSRLDIISRKLFGLLAYLAREKTFDTDGYHARYQNCRRRRTLQQFNTRNNAVS